MKKILLLLLLSLPCSSFAQWVDVSTLYGIAPYKISAGIKNGSSGTYNIEASLVKLKFLDFGVQYSAMNTVTICKVTTPGVFADVVYKDKKNKNIFIAGIKAGYSTFGNVPIGGAYFKDGSRDMYATTVDKSLSYGLRIGYKRQIIEHLYAFVMISPSYTSSMIHYANVSSNNCAVLSVPCMIGISGRF